jgi:hypothetical protein
VESRHKGAPGLWKGEGALSFFEYDAGTPLPEAERRPRPPTSPSGFALPSSQSLSGELVQA